MSAIVERRFVIRNLCQQDASPWVVFGRATGAIVVVDGQPLEFAELEDARTWCQLNQPSKAISSRNSERAGQQ